MEALDTTQPPSRRIVFLIHDGFQLLNLTGPMEVFAGANQWSQHFRSGQTPYKLEVVAERSGSITSSTGLPVVAASLPRTEERFDTVVVVGGQSMDRQEKPDSANWLRRAAQRSRRIVSVCNGAFLLAQAGLLEGRQATTHWAYCDKLGRKNPSISVEPDSIFVEDGRVWTSAGVSAGMDLSLALVERDLGREAALTIARWLVLFVKRPGGQAQFSEQLALQTAESRPLRKVQSWIADHLAEDLSVSTVAERAGMSPRHFSRVFKREMGVTPARYVERLRVEAARRLLEDSSYGVSAVAGRCGFGTEETLRRTFLRRVGIPPRAYRERFVPPSTVVSPAVIPAT